jgi:hypothetical protein
LIVDAVDHHFELIADVKFLGIDGERELAEVQDAFGLAADVDEQLVLVLGDDQSDENLAFVENLEALFIHALFERELVFFDFFRRWRCDVGGGSNTVSPLLGAPDRFVRSHRRALRSSLKSEGDI